MMQEHLERRAEMLAELEEERRAFEEDIEKLKDENRQISR